MTSLLRGGLIALLACVPAAGAQEAGKSAVERLGVEIRSDAPMAISSDELEALRDESGAERVTFSRNVVVEQGSLRIYCDRLDATYSQGERGGKPERITASGSVRIVQPGREAHCDVATVDNLAQTAVCKAESGKVRMRRGEDVIEADSIEFNLTSGGVRAKGGVKIEVRPEEAAE